MAASADLKAIKAKYPDLQLIATTPVKSPKPDVIDDHYYMRAMEFFDDVHHYDRQPGSPSMGRGPL